MKNEDQRIRRYDATGCKAAVQLRGPSLGPRRYAAFVVGASATGAFAKARVIVWG